MTILQHKIPAVIWQFPGNFKKDLQRIKSFADARYALEFRNESWFDGEISELLGRYSLANCISDAKDWPRRDAVTTDMVYVRLHENEETYHSRYNDAEMEEWAKIARSWLDEGRSVHVYFDNTDAGAAPENALQLKELLNS